MPAVRAAVSGCQVDPKRLIALKTPIEVIKRLGSIQSLAAAARRRRWTTQAVEDRRGGGRKRCSVEEWGVCVFRVRVSRSASTVFFKEVDAGMKDRSKNTLFWGLSTK